MKYTDLNTVMDVGASCHLLEIGPFKVLIDCGVHPQLMGNQSLPKLDFIGSDTLDIVAITHAHLDHCGALPLVADSQRTAHILTGEGSSELVVRMLRNSKGVMMKQRKEYDIKEYPLYENSSLDALSKRIVTMPHGQERMFESNGEIIKITFFRAGHVFGASSILVEYKKEKIFFSGDICFHSTPILKGAIPPEGKIDVLVMESTRGAYEVPAGTTHQGEAKRFIDSVAKVISEGGSVLVPSFALGRAQEVLNLLHIAKAMQVIPADCPIFSGGLGLDIAEHIAEYSKKYSHFHFGKSCLEGVAPLRQEIIPGQDFDTKGVYVLGSGMMVPNTPSYATAAALIEHRANAIFFVGYADPDSPAGRLLSCRKNEDFAFPELSYVGKTNCRIEKFDLSAHANRDEILNFILQKDPRSLILTHGSEEARDWFMYEILDMSPKTQVIIPQVGETLEV